MSMCKSKLKDQWRIGNCRRHGPFEYFNSLPGESSAPSLDVRMAAAYSENRAAEYVFSVFQDFTEGRRVIPRVLKTQGVIFGAGMT